MAGETIIKVKVSMPASAHLRIREHARAIGSNLSRLCCESTLKAIDHAERAVPTEAESGAL